MKGLHVLLGVTGGIAAYKAADLASRLTARGAVVDCIMTKSAGKLIRARTFEAVTGRAVFTKMWTSPEAHRITHINLAEAADIVVVAPATANILAKAACGICDDLLSTTLCVCWNKPVLIAPAMNCSMWANPAVQRNVETLRAMKFEMIGPETGRLACGAEGVGRMAEPADILAAVEAAARRIRQS
ncbi:MAG: phosphopantothenoylcysteine decarboxylase [Phycisphaerae bacterium]|nr:phosphopantothenoylcysteine decarboxylase [Phycisphaerae bacterium]